MRLGLLIGNEAFVLRRGTPVPWCDRMPLFITGAATTRTTVDRRGTVALLAPVRHAAILLS